MLWSWILVEILKLGLVKILNFMLSGDADVWLRFLVYAQSRFWSWNESNLCVWNCYMTSRSYFGKINSTLGSVVPLAMFINKEDTKTIIANQLEGILIGLAMFLWHHNIISIVECSVVLLSTLTELVTKLLERQLFSCVLTQCNFKQTSTESLSNKQKEFKDKVVSVTKKRKRRKVYYICWVTLPALVGNN